MNSIYIISETDERGQSPNPIAYCTELDKAIHLVSLELQHNKTEVKSRGGYSFFVDFLTQNLQTQGLETNYIIEIQETNKIIQ